MQDEHQQDNGAGVAVEEPEAAPQTPDEARVERVSAGLDDVTEKDVDALTAYFLGRNAARPGEGQGALKRFALNIEPDEEGTMTPREQMFAVRAISWEEWQEAQRLGMEKPRGSSVEEQNQFLTSSYVCAFAIVEPNLGALREQMDPKPKDTAAMLRDVFRMQPGSLIQMQNVVLRKSRLALSSNSIREVDAAKT